MIFHRKIRGIKMQQVLVGERAAVVIGLRGCLVIAFALVSLFTSCAKKSPSEAVIVSAAASTKEAIESICSQFSESNGAEVKVNTGASNALATQILAGAPADLFLSASKQWAAELQKANLVKASAPLLSNRLVVVVPKSNPAAIRQPADLLSDKIKKVALAGENVPAGMYADQALTKLNLLKPLADAGKIVRGQDVRTALSYVERGEAEAGIVYSTDVRIADNLEIALEFDPQLHDEIVYVLVLLKHGSANPAAQKLYDYLQSPDATTAYQKFGFLRAASEPN